MRSPIIPLLPLFCLAALPAGAMTLKSTDIREGEPMDKVFSFNGFGCSGENRSPQLSWQSLPAGMVFCQIGRASCRERVSSPV